STSPSRTQPSATRSLKKMARGFCSPIRLPCRLPREKTSICESIGSFSASSADCRNPLRPVKLNRTVPSWSFALTSATALSRAVDGPPEGGHYQNVYQMASTLTHLECSRCRTILEHTRPQNLCPKCASPLLARYDLAKAARTLSLAALKTRTNSMWRYEE